MIEMSENVFRLIMCDLDGRPVEPIADVSPALKEHCRLSASLYAEVGYVHLLARARAKHRGNASLGQRTRISVRLPAKMIDPSSAIAWPLPWSSTLSSVPRSTRPVSAPVARSSEV